MTRYEVWRLPPVEDELGFVSVALVADMDAAGDIMEQVDKRIGEWRETLDDDNRHPWHRRRR
ncbi:hypothetical protein FBZ91_1012 [Nitrospirillum viridazoti]|uniref:Uncharacterized protein n=1 Tax=Nitrospirillum viridazoti CBAmc TaxID=1441467 RepID=A0A248JZW2_9PROT|nr:hypothetical protein Y958_24075 [Nitrospirillum amazonense CBAmc]TWB44531.1 hypothetical protein FBZ91_1012 [Nitrospirillum amazonense]